MDTDMAERLYQAAEDSLRASLAAWGAAFDAAQATGNDRVRWMVEEAAWSANRRANVVRNLAWELADQVLSASREQVRGQLLGQPVVHQAPPAAPAPAPPAYVAPETVVRLTPETDPRASSA